MMTRRVPLARRNALADRQRLAIAVFGVGLALGLIFLLEGLWQGFRLQISAYEDHVGADLFVAQSGTQNFLSDTSIIPTSVVEEIRSMPGVEQAHPILARFVVLELHDEKQFMFLIAAQPDKLGEPWLMRAGRRVASTDEAVIDHTLAGQHGIEVGDRIEINGRDFAVVGLSGDTRSWMASFVFISHAAGEQLFNAPGSSSHVLVKTADPGPVASEIERLTGLTAIPSARMAANDRSLLTEIVGAPLNVMVVAAFLAGTIIVALTVYSAIIDRIREYGIARAMGARAGLLFRVVLGQTMVLAALGVVTGFAVYEVAWRLVAVVSPQFWVRLTPGTVLGVLAAALGMALLAAVVPTRRVVRLDPASVYRG